jgi:hypothetical protein
MRLILQNGYPYPYPEGLLSPDEEAKIAEAAAGKTFEINGVIHFEWKHTLTVEFGDQDEHFNPQELTGWRRWGSERNILEALTSGLDGYDHPAIIVGDTAYCGFILKEE